MVKFLQVCIITQKKTFAYGEIMEKIDRRKQKTNSAIEKTFLELILQKGFDNITVKKITEKANIVRKTFYLHYNDIYDLLDKIIEDEIRQLEILCENKKGKSWIEGTSMLFEYFFSKKILFSALFSIKKSSLFREKLLDFMIREIEKHFNMFNQEKNAIYSRFFAVAIFGILESLILGNLPTDYKIAAEQVGKLLENNLMQL